MTSKELSISMVQSWQRPLWQQQLKGERSLRREEMVRRLLKHFCVLCFTQALSIIRVICISLFLFESLKENFHIVWIFSPKKNSILFGIFPLVKFQTN